MTMIRASGKLAAKLERFGDGDDAERGGPGLEPPATSVAPWP